MYRPAHRARRLPLPRSVRAVVVAVVGVAVTAVGVLTAASSQGAVSRARVDGVITSVFQHRDRSVTVNGFAWDTADRNGPAYVCIGVGRTCLRVVKAASPSPRFDRRNGVTGPHAFHARIRPLGIGATVTLLTPQAGHQLLDRKRAVTAGQQVLSIARRYVGRVPYVWGGASPRTGFDCSGFAMYAYRTAGVFDLPHNSQLQRFSRYMHRIPQSQALPGDLVFYMSGDYSYHTAIYAGHDRQVSAIDPSQGIHFQKIWNSDVIFGTDWH